ncbi:hypothetical protein EG328_006002 [Venturia inaequalis]|uniref:NAD-dependent epimerase/dehydratase domain-containing protein n=1 Tax=Venturia inaequalis TaxID=5025 RepID=A0A8H3YVR4_VENIN|nr:hypothetical protein EG328_006002 [Venturia inaequalis]
MGETILITGATGYIGFKTMLLALEAGYKVRAVIRKQGQADKLKTHPKIAPYAANLEFAVISDLTQDGAFDEALLGIDAVLHLASPLANETDDYERDIIKPAVAVNISLLHSALTHTSVKRIIITSSMVTLIPFSWLSTPNTTKTYSSTDTNTTTTGPFTLAMEAYWSSKALARLAVRDFVTTKTPGFEVIQLLPSVVIGADDRATSLEDLKTNTPLWSLKLSPLLGIKQDTPMVGVPVDVADVARAHVDAINPRVPGNKEYVLSAETPNGVVWNDMIGIVEERWPERVGKSELPLGGSLPSTVWKIDVGETEEAFGWGFRAFEDTVAGVVGQYLELFNGEV